MDKKFNFRTPPPNILEFAKEINVALAEPQKELLLQLFEDEDTNIPKGYGKTIITIEYARLRAKMHDKDNIMIIGAQEIPHYIEIAHRLGYELVEYTENKKLISKDRLYYTTTAKLQKNSKATIKFGKSFPRNSDHNIAVFFDEPLRDKLNDG